MGDRAIRGGSSGAEAPSRLTPRDRSWPPAACKRDDWIGTKRNSATNEVLAGGKQAQALCPRVDSCDCAAQTYDEGNRPVAGGVRDSRASAATAPGRASGVAADTIWTRQPSILGARTSLLVQVYPAKSIFSGILGNSQAPSHGGDRHCVTTSDVAPGPRARRAVRPPRIGAAGDRT
jgi:hypothetical protein